ncbi:MAG: elongation factor P [Dehalococcoidales bacterium]|jgi:elongation factor P
MIGIGDFKRGIVIEHDGELYQVLDFQHVKMKRTALAKAKLRNIRAGHIVERTFQNTEKFVRVRMEYRDMQYLYQDGELYYFMDQENFEQMPLSEAQLGDTLSYIKEGMSLQVASYKGEIIGVEMPITVELAVTETDPGFKGDTATGGTKPAKLETGVTISVPLFVNTGDVIKVDTRTGTYLERV